MNYKLDNSVSNIKTDAVQYEHQNKNYLNSILPFLKNVMTYEFSRLTPYVWITFKNEQKKLENLKYLSEKEFVVLVFSYDETYESIEPNSLIPNICNGSDCKENTIPEEPAVLVTDVSEKTPELEEYLEKEFKIINFIKQRERENKRTKETENNDKSPLGSIGILEPELAVVDEDEEYFKNKIVEKYNSEHQIVKPHATKVAAIAAGVVGVDRYSKIYSAGFLYTDSLWQKQIEWMVIDNDVKIINHSYEPGSNSKNGIDYNESSYFLDYIARKYGVINVFSAGNGDNDRTGERNKWIDSIKLSFNSIVVGSVTNIKNRSDYEKSIFSNYKKNQKYSNLPKPLISAPGEKIKIFLPPKKMNDLFGFILQNGISGTSFAAPFVSGAISTLLREKKHLFNDDNRVQSIKAILAASAFEKNNLNNVKEENGLTRGIGAGLLDFEKMLEAADNLKTVTVFKDQKDTVITYDDISLTKGETIQISSAWLFNAGLLRKKTSESFLLGVLFSIFLSALTQTDNSEQLAKILEEEEKKYQFGEWLKKDEAFKIQKQQFFTNYDLWLEEKIDDVNWKIIKRVEVIDSNVELIRYKALNNNKLRIRVIKQNDILSLDSVPDKISITYTKH